jgi:dTDP-4-dehydrorhamnose 3,5-epimerase
MEEWVASTWSETEIPGVRRRSMEIVADLRGSFTELWRASATEGLSASPFVQANLSRSATDVLRGMHFHRHQTDLWMLIEGRAFVAVADLRHYSQGLRLPVATFEMHPGDAVVIPEMVAHGFHALEPIALVYLVTNEYDGSDELGFSWDDPEAGIPWLVDDPIVSDRDRANPSLRAAISQLGR